MTIAAMLYLYQGNAIEVLADELCRKISAPPVDDPFYVETVVIPNHGLGRWLSLRIAEFAGICAQVRFLFPAEYVWEVSRRIVPDLPAGVALSPGELAWQIFATTEDLIALAGDDPVAAYLRHADEGMRYEFAARLARVYDQYLVYRPDWILAWQEGETPHWQAAYWRLLRRRLSRPHWADIQKQVLSRLSAAATAEETIPLRTFIFGIPALSPGYLATIAALAGHRDVLLFVFNPCSDYWGDIVSARDLARRGHSTEEQRRYYFTQGNPLLGALGKQGRDYIDLLLDYAHEEYHCFCDPGDASLLRRVQREILTLSDGEPVRACAAARSFQADRSIQFHACHSPMREVEVLFDHILSFLESVPGVTPSDIVVLTPDIDEYAPYIEAVFSQTLPDGRRIPFSIADRAAAAEGTLIAGILELLDLFESRFRIDEVVALLDIAAVRRRYRFGESDVEKIHDLLRGLNVRWGLDERHRQELGVPATRRWSWAQGVDRLLLGFAMGGAAVAGAAGRDIHPAAGIDSGDADMIGSLHEFVGMLRRYHEDVRASRPVAKWQELILALIDDFFAPDLEQEDELQILRNTLHSMVDEALRAGVNEPLSFALIRQSLRERLAAEENGGGFLGNGITFAKMVPLRSIPFKVICLIGMNGHRFPRTPPQLSFDLIAQNPRRGDRARRDDDRYLFLELLMSAREVFYVSYVGQDIRDNSMISPSGVVSELLDYLGDDGQVVKHPLQPFNRAYFNGADGGMFSYQEHFFQACKALSAPRRSPTFFSEPLPPPGPLWRVVDIADLVRFFRYPAKFLLKERVGIVIDEWQEVLDHREPLTLGKQSLRRLTSELVAAHLRGEAVQQALDRVAIRGDLPGGTVGQWYAQQLAERTQHLVSRLAALPLAADGEPVTVDYCVGAFRITGFFSDITAGHRVEYVVGEAGAGDRLAWWIRHVFLQPAQDGLTSYLVDEKGIRVLPPLAAADTVQQELLELYWQGLSEPLHFSPKASWCYYERLRKGKEEALAAASRKWYGSDQERGEARYAYNELAFRGRMFLDSAFAHLAEMVFAPLVRGLR